jgi:hypothetical protein
MRTLLIAALAATLVVGCSCTLLPKTGGNSCTDANGVACFDRMAASQPVEPKPESSETDSGTAEIKSTIAAKPEKPSSAHARDGVHRAIKTAKSTTMTAKGEPAAPRVPLSPRSFTGTKVGDLDPGGSAVANSNTRTIQEQVAAATAAAEQNTVATMLPAPKLKANDEDRSNHSETVLRGDAEKSPPASRNNTDLLVVLLIARPEIKLVSDLTSKSIAIDHRHSASNGNVRTAIAAAGAAGVQLSEGPGKAIDRMISAEVPAAVLTLVSAEAAERFPEIAGFKIFRIPLSPRSLKT